MHHKLAKKELSPLCDVDEYPVWHSLHIFLATIFCYLEDEI